MWRNEKLPITIDEWILSFVWDSQHCRWKRSAVILFASCWQMSLLLDCWYSDWGNASRIETFEQFNAVLQWFMSSKVTNSLIVGDSIPFDRAINKLAAQSAIPSIIIQRRVGNTSTVAFKTADNFICLSSYGYTEGAQHLGGYIVNLKNIPS